MKARASRATAHGAVTAAIVSGFLLLGVGSATAAGLPIVTTDEASAVEASTATLHAEVDPGGAQLSACSFEYGEAEIYGHTAPCLESDAAVGAGEEAVTVHADLTGLTPRTEVHFRILAANEVGPVQGEDRAFTTKPPPPLASFDGPFAGPQALSVDPATHDVYVVDVGAGRGTGSVARFTASGVPDDFTAGPGAGTDSIPGLWFDGGPSAAEVAIAPPGSPAGTAGNIYIADREGVRIYSSTGAFLGAITEAGGQPFEEACGIATDSSGALYVADFEDRIDRFIPTEDPPTAADFDSAISGAGQDCALAAGGGALYAAAFEAPRTLTRYPTSLFPGGGQTADIGGLGTVLEAEGAPVAATAIVVDPVSGDLYVDQGSEISVFDSSGAPRAFSPYAAGRLSASYGVAIDGATGASYVSDAGAEPSTIYRFGPAGAELDVPEVVTEPATGVDGSVATLRGQVDPVGAGEVTECRFEYVSDAAFEASGFSSLSSGGSVACAQPVPIAEPGEVSAQVAGLSPGILYHYRLRASDANGRSLAAVATFATGPLIDATSASAVTSTSADLRAEIDPQELQTDYHFEYLDAADFLADGAGFSGPRTPTSTAVATVAAAGSDQAVSVHLQGLAPGTEFHYRVVASNQNGAPTGPTRTFTTPEPTGSGSLPDDRGYELVSPLDKNGGELAVPSAGFSAAEDQSSLDGGAITYATYVSFDDPQGAPYVSQYVARRGPEGWSNENITPPLATPIIASPTTQYKAFSPDLSVGALFDAYSPTLGAGAIPGISNIYLRRGDAGPAYTPVTVLRPSGEGDYEPIFEAASADFSHVVFQPDDHFGEPRQHKQDTLYDWSQGEDRRVDILPDGEPSEGFPFLGADGGFNVDNVDHAVSADGSRIFWTDGSGEPGDGTGQIYVRIDDARTLPVSPGPATFWAADPSGGEVLFTMGGDLYMDEIDSSRPTDLTPGGGVQGLLGASEDLDYVYVVARSDLAAGATAGEDNLYLLHGGTTTFIATLGHEEADTPVSHNETRPIDDYVRPTSRTATITSDGRHVAFLSTRSLTGYDNTNPTACPPQTDEEGNVVDPAGRCTEVYLYDAGTDHLSCASCNPSGALPIGPSAIPTWENQSYDPRSLSEDGSRLFFESSDALVPRDTNGSQDVYEYENGSPHLISTGTGNGDAEFFDASADGSDVFFTTKQSLVPADTDTHADLYDARVGGGFPAPPAPAPVCEGDACQSPVTAPPEPAIASAGYRGPGDPAPRFRRHGHKRHHRENHRHKKRGPRADQGHTSGPGRRGAR